MASVSQLRRMMQMATPHQETVTGDVASFVTDFPAPARVKAEFSPVQDLHGYANPWPAGGGKNLLKTGGLVQGAPSSTSFSNATKRTFTIGTFVTNLTANNYYQNNRVTQVSVAENAISVTTVASSYAVAIPMTGLTVGSTYALSMVKTNGAFGVGFYKEDGTFISNTITNRSSFTIPEETYYTLIHFNAISDGTQATFTDIQLELGSTATTYAPYENVCPITGWDGCKVTRTGKNLFNYSQLEVGGINPSTGGNYSQANLSRLIGYILVTESTVYSLSGGAGGIRIFYYRNDESFISSYLVADGNGTFTTPAGTKLIRVAGSTENITIVTQIERGSSSSAFAPYSSQTIPISWQSSAGTVYGGNIQLNEDGSGVLVADRAIKTYNGSETWTRTAATGGYQFYTGGISPLQSSPLAICDRYITTTSTDVLYARDNHILLISWRVAVHDNRYTEVEDFKAYLAEQYNNGTPLTVCYILSNPTTYPLSADQLRTLLGVNNVWTSLNGSVTVRLFKHG